MYKKKNKKKQQENKKRDTYGVLLRAATSALDGGRGVSDVGGSVSRRLGENKTYSDLIYGRAFEKKK